MATPAEILDDIAAIGLHVSALSRKAIYGPGTAYGRDLGVQPFPDSIGDVLPAMVTTMGPRSVIGGSHERQTWQVDCSLWSEYSPRGDRYRELLELMPLVHQAFRDHGKASSPDAALQIVQVVEIGAVDVRRWTPDGADRYLVQPFTLEAKVNLPNARLVPA